MQAGRITDGYVTREPFVAVKAIALVWPCADAILALGALSKVADVALPACVAEAEVWKDTSAVDAVWVTDGRHAVDTCPPLKALAALPVVFVVVEETAVEKIHAASFDQLSCLY